jgi:hypothetical protein
MSGVHNLPGYLPEIHLRAILDAFYSIRDIFTMGIVILFKRFNGLGDYSLER